MTDVCKKAISQCEEIVFSNKEFKASEIFSKLGISDTA